jgi:ubiquinone biosynthesis protein
VPWIVIPRIHWQWTSERLNVQDYVAGISGRELVKRETAGIDRALLAQRGAEAVMKMVLEDGFFHADPHLGNFFCLPDNRLALLDFGMVGRLGKERRDQVVLLLHALVMRDTAAAIEILSDWTGDTPVDAEALANELDAFLDDYYGVPLKRIDFAALLTDLVALLRDHQLVLPPDLALLFKALITLDGVGRRLDPDFDLVSCARPFVERLIAQRYLPGTLAQRSFRQLRTMADVLASLPADLRRLLRSLRRGNVQVNVDMARLDHFGNQLDRAASRMTIGIVTASIIVGSSIVMTVGGESEIFGIPALGFLGFVGASLGGIWLLFSIWRSGRD